MNFRKHLLFTVLLSLFSVSNAFATDFYWVNNSGNWNDASHWSNTSGGDGGVGIPTINDDVYFDKYSFTSLNQEVLIHADIELNNLSISSNSTNFKLSSTNPITIDIYGILNISTTLKNELKGSLNFKSNENITKELNFGVNSWNIDINFNGKGTYILNSPIHDVNKKISLISGELNLNQNSLYCGSFISESNKKRTIISANSSIYIYNKWITNPNKLNHDFSQSNIYILNSVSNSVNKNGENFNIIQSQGTSNKVITSTSITTDTSSCGDQCDGMIIVNFTTACPSGATVSWNGSSNPDPDGDDNGAVTITTGSDTIFNICPGIEYTATIIDDCDGAPAFPLPKATVLGHSKITTPINPLINEPSCNGVCDADILVFVDAAGWVISNNYLTYQWSPGGPADTTTSLSGMCAGTNYALQASDGHGCDTTFNFVITEPDSLYANVSVTNPLCFNDCSGSATSNPIGGTAPYSYLWSPSTADPALDTVPTFNNLCDGVSYSVTITDNNGCVNDTTITPSEPAQMQIDTASSRPSCGGDSDGSITVTVTVGGTAPFTHNWSTGFSETIGTGISSTINGLSAGNYCDTIRDLNGCDTIICFTLTEPDTVLTNTITTDLTCNGICNGTATTFATGGTTPYNYAWDSIPNAGGFTTFDSIVNLCPGTYFVIVTDLKNCSASDTITISEPPLLVANTSSTDITCPNFNNGTATANPSGGNPGTTGYSYTWIGPACNPSPGNTQSISSLCVGTYYVTVTDSAGCTAIDSVIITEPTPLNLAMSSTDETCAGNCDGVGFVNATGGTGNPDSDFIYNWNPNPTNGQGTDSIFGLCPNTYTLTVTDSAGCSSNNAVTISPSPDLDGNLTSSNLTCNDFCNGSATVSPTGAAPFTVSWDGAAPIVILIGQSNTISGLCAGPHTGIIIDDNGCKDSINFTINEPAALTITTTPSDVSCFGLCDGSATTIAGGGSGTLTYFWDSIPSGFNGSGQGTNSVSDLCAGTYYIQVEDDSSCTINDTIIILEPNEIFPNVTFTNISCNGLNDGTATSLPTGGAAPPQFSWTGPGTFSSNAQSIGPLAAGQYTVTVTDNNNCTSQEMITIIDPPALTVDASASGASCGAICDGMALATPNGGTPGTTSFSYSWNTIPVQTTQTATGLCIGEYQITITDSMGCTAQDTTEINNLIIIGITTSAVGLSCNGVCDGTASASPSGGASPYQFQWSGNNTNPNDTLDNITGLCPGRVYITVTDANGCVSIDSVDMPIDPPVLFPNGQIDQEISCFGQCDAQISHNPTGGTPPYTSVWSVADTNNVCPSFAVITITDDNGCIQSDTLIINEPDSIDAHIVVVDVLCNGDSTGSITLSPTGGTGGTYFYTWVSGPIIGSGASTTNLPAGIYTIEVRDSNGCMITVVDTINEYPILSSNPTGVNVSCNSLCDGMMTVNVNGGVQPYNYNWQNNQPTLPASQDTLFNVCAPFLSNTVTITDANGCTSSQTITIVEPNPLDANVTGTTILCNNDCNGTAISTPTGGTPGYTYQWTTSVIPPPANLTDSALSNLCVGNYFITVTDNSGCTDTSTFTVDSPLALQVTLDSTNITCNGNNNGTATANTSGGTLPYTFSWIGGNASATDTNFIENLIPGVYTVTVTDGNNCSFTGSINIVEPQPIDDNEVITVANCGTNDGSIVMFPSGGTSPYTHSWSNGITSASNSNLSAGFYTDTITDFNGCVAIFTIGVSNPTGPQGVTPTINDATCFGSCTGSINVIVIGGAPNFTYTWTGPNGFNGTDSTETALCAGTYNLQVEDANNCILATNLVVGEADSIRENSTFTDATCNGVCDGTASITPTGGTAPYSYVWSSNSSTGSSISGLCTGAESVTITDFFGCQKVVNFNIGSPNSLTVTSNTTNPTCNTSCNGTATANPVDGTGPYTYQWNDLASQTGQTATGLCDGTYIVTVTDFNGCSENDTIVITEPTPITVTPITTNSTCGNADGTADVSGSVGGTGVHTYSWPSIPTTTPNPSGLAAGTYTVEITDANLCMQPFLVTISDANGPTVTTSQINASCDGICDGQATATATGTANLTYLWQTGGQTTPTLTGLCAGNYSVEVTDGNGCKTTEPVTITDNTAITATASTVSPTCNGDCDGSALVTPNGGVPPYSYSWIGGNAAGQTINAVGGLCAGNYTVTITDFIGCSFPLDVTINEPNILTTSVAGIAANCNNACDGQATATPNGGTAPFTYLWSTGATTSTITALCAGTYTVTITDFNGCTAPGMVTIGDGVAITTTTNTTDANCGQCDGEITVNGAGGSGAPYTYLWSVNGSTNPTISNLCPGSYIVDITDNLGCSEQFTILINNANGPTLTTLADSATCFGTCNGLAYTSVIAGTPSFNFQWDDPALQQNDSATGLCAGLYNIVVQDGVGCITVDTVSVLEPEEILPNFTSTNPTCPTICDGTATVNPTGGTGTFTFQWNGDLTPGQTNSISGLCGGTHTILITDSKGCTKLDSITISDPTAITITASATQPTCFGDCDGTAIANASGGNPGYQYSWDTNPIENNSLIGGLCAGQYIVTVTDNNNCTAADTIQVIDPAVLGTTSTPTNPSCGNTCDGEITTTPTGGTQPYTYIWSNGQTTPTISNLCAGIYDVIIVDANNCTFNDTITLTEIILDAAIDTTSPDCGIPNGSITSTPVGAGPYNFVWSDAANTVLQTDLGATNSIINGLNAGTYNLEITDQGTGCISNYTIILNNPNGPTLALTSTDETCLNQCNGTATATPTGGTAPYSFSWSPTTPTDTNQTATNLCADFYTVTVTDSNNCITSDTTTINTIGLSLSITSIVPETCFGDADGSATVAVSGGVPTYDFSWSPSGGTSATTTPSPVGNYIVTVTDAVNCSDSISAIITGPDVLTVLASENTPVSCNGLSNGAAIANVLGGTPNYIYSWNTTPIQTTQIATNLAAGTYIVTVTDDNGCSAMDTITLIEPDSILDNSTLLNPTCGVCDGAIEVTPTGGSGNYSFIWTTPGAPPLAQPNTALINSLCAGAYTLVITDNTSGCSTAFNYPLSNTNAPDPNTTTNSITCNGLCNGSIYSEPNGGLQPYSYLWNSGNPNTDSTITNLCSGQYSITVTDANGCIGVAIDSVTQPAILQANLLATNLNCNGTCDGTVVSQTLGGTTPYQTFSWGSNPAGQITLGQGTDSISNLCFGDYFVDIVDANGCTVSDTISISEPTSISSTSTQLDATCSSNCDGEATITPSGGIGPYTFQWNGNTTPNQGNNQTSLCFGLNEILIFDQNGCSILDSIFIGATDTVLTDAGLDTNYCLGTPVNLNGVPGGTFTNVEWFELPSMTSLGITDSIIATPSSAGTISYAFQVTGACTISDTVNITVDPLPVVDAGNDVDIFEGRNTQLNATGGVSYSWSPTLGLNDSTISNPTASPEITTTYFVTATSANGCVATDSVIVTVLPHIKFPDGISPNGDGANDVWIIDFIEQYPENVVEIYNRWGELLFHADGYQQDWDGTYNGKELPIGTYYYIIDLHDESIEPFTGPLTILR